MARGDHIRVRRPLYRHHGIDMGDGSVIHATGEPGRMKLDAEVRRTPLADFLRGGVDLEVVTATGFTADEVASRAESALGDRSYSLLFNNCEHFARWCQTGAASSRQVDSYAIAGTAVGVAAQVLLRTATSRGGLALASRALALTSPATSALAVVGAAIVLSSRMRGRADAPVNDGLGDRSDQPRG